MLSNELTYFINEEHDAKIAIVLIVEIFFHFRGECFHGYIYIIFENSLTNDIDSQGRIHFLSHLQSQIQTTGGKT